MLSEDGETIYVVGKPRPGRSRSYETVGNIVRDGDQYLASIRTSGAAAIYKGLPELDLDLGIAETRELSVTISGESLDGVARRVDQFLLWAFGLGQPEVRLDETLPEQRWRASFRDTGRGGKPR